MQGLLNQMRRVASEVMSSRAVTRQGKVSSYDPAQHAVKVGLQPDGTLTDWIPLKSASVGNGFGIYAAPNVGDVIEVHFQEDDGGVPTAGLRFFHNDARPLPVPAGEIWIAHASGAMVKLTNDGKLTLLDGHGAVIALSGDGKISSAGDWTHTGKFTSSDDVTANGVSLEHHKHGGVSTGSGQTGEPA